MNAYASCCTSLELLNFVSPRRQERNWRSAGVSLEQREFAGPLNVVRRAASFVVLLHGLSRKCFTFPVSDIFSRACYHVKPRLSVHYNVLETRIIVERKTYP